MQLLHLLDDSNLPMIPKDFLGCWIRPITVCVPHRFVTVFYSTPLAVETAAKPWESISEVIRKRYCLAG